MKLRRRWRSADAKVAGIVGVRRRCRRRRRCARGSSAAAEVTRGSERAMTPALRDSIARARRVISVPRTWLQRAMSEMVAAALLPRGPRRGAAAGCPPECVAASCLWRRIRSRRSGPWRRMGLIAAGIRLPAHAIVGAVSGKRAARPRARRRVALKGRAAALKDRGRYE